MNLFKVGKKVTFLQLSIVPSFKETNQIFKFFEIDNNKSTLLLEKVFIFMTIWMTGKNSVKHHYLKNKIFTVF